MTICVTDLDGTLVFIAGPHPELCEVERFASGRVARIHRDTVRGWCALASLDQLIVSTSRTVEQFRRASLPAAPYVLATNGLDLIDHGTIDLKWRDERLGALAVEVEPWSRIGSGCLAALGGVDLRPGVIGDYFVVMVGSRDAVSAGAERLSAQVNSVGWRVVPVGRKLYLLPTRLDKQQGVAALLARLQIDQYIAAGDSMMDLAMLGAAQRSVVPCGSDLETARIPDLTVTHSGGTHAGRDIVAWFRATRAGLDSES